MKNILITGAGGFVGSQLAKKMLSEDHLVVAVDIVDFPCDKLEQHPKLIYKKMNINDLDTLGALISSYQIDTFYHFAWKGSSGPLRSDIHCQVENALLTSNILKVCSLNKCNRFVFAGSIMEFEVLHQIYDDSNEPMTSCYYGVGKSLAHEICKPLALSLNMELIWVYITNAYGVGEFSPRLINGTIRKCIKNEQLEFTSGIQNYDFVYISDVIEAFYLIGKKGKANKTYVIGSGNAKQLRLFLEELVSICNPKLTPIFGAASFAGVNLPLDTFSIKDLISDCGYSPKISFSEGIKLTYEWIKNKECL